VDVLQGFGYLVDVVGSSFFVVFAPWLGLKVLVELTSRDILKNQVNFVFIVEEPIHGQDVRMAQVTTYLDFPLQLLFNTALFNLLFVEYLNCTDKF
jgi:hypothetical protein